jgi:hypothetical protein
VKENYDIQCWFFYLSWCSLCALVGVGLAITNVGLENLKETKNKRERGLTLCVCVIEEKMVQGERDVRCVCLLL